jgi:hypothetical protein
MNIYTLIILGLIIILLSVIFYFTFVNKSNNLLEGFYNPSGKYILLPITTQKDDIYNFPINIDTSSSEKLRASIYNHDIANLDSNYSKDDILNQLKHNYYSVIINRLKTIEGEDGKPVEATIIKRVFIANQDAINSKLNESSSNLIYRKTYNSISSTFNNIAISVFNKCSSNPSINNCGYGDGNESITDYVVLEIAEDITDEQLNTYFNSIDKYVINSNIKYKIAGDDEFISLESNDLPFNMELTDDLISGLTEIPSELFSLHQYYLMFIRVNKGILKEYPTTNGNIETRYNPLKYLNTNYKQLMNILYKAFKAPLSVENRNNFNMLSNRIYDISIASKSMLEKIDTTFINDSTSDKHRYHQLELVGAVNCNYNLVFDEDSNEYTLAKLNIGNTSALEISTIRDTLNKCGPSNTLFTNAPTEIETAEEMAEVSGGRFINIPLIFKVDSEVNPTDLYSASSSLEGYSDIISAPINLFIKLNPDNNNILSITPQSYLLKLNDITALNSEFSSTMSDKLRVLEHMDYIPIADSDFDSSLYPDFEETPTTTQSSSSTPTTTQSSSSTPTTTQSSSSTPTTTQSASSTPTTTQSTSSTPTTTQSSSSTSYNRQSTDGVLSDINGNPLSYGLSSGSSPGTNSSHQGQIISSPGFYTEQPNTIRNSIVGNIDDLTVSELHSQMHQLDPYFGNYSLPDVKSRGNIYVKDYKGNLNIFYPNIVSY